MTLKSKALLFVSLVGLTSATAQAAPASASLVFEGNVPVVTPGDALIITGVDGIGVPTKGSLTVDTAGRVQTEDVVQFEVREYTEATNTVGERAGSYSVTVANIHLSAGAAVVDNAGNLVHLNGAEQTVNTPVNFAGDAGKRVHAMSFANLSGFDIKDVGSSTIRATVNVMVSPLPATPGA